MGKSVLLSLLIYLIVLIGLATRQGSLLLLAVPLVLYLLAALLLRPRTLSIAVNRVLSEERVFQGAPAELTITLTNQGPALNRLLVEAPMPAGLGLRSGQTRLVTRLGPGESVTLTQAYVTRRGLHALPPLQIVASDPGGLFLTTQRIADTSRLLVLPAIDRAAEFGIQPPRTRVYAGPIPARKGGPGVEFYGVRAYQPGDSLHWINHRLSARHPDDYYVNEFLQERAADIGLIVDVRRSANLVAGSHSLLDHSVEAAAALADAFLAAGNRVGLFLYGGGIDWTVPGYGKVQRERIMQTLARAKPEEHQVFSQLGYLPTRLFPIRSQLVLISPLRADDVADLISLRARGYELLIAAPDAVAFEEARLADGPNRDLAKRLARLDRERVFAQLRQAGIQLFEWSTDVPFHLAARGEMRRLAHWRRGPGLR